MSGRRTAQRLVLAALAVIATGLPAHAQVGQHPIAVTFHDGAPDVSFSAADFADDTVRHRLSRGLLTTIVMTTYASTADSTTPIAVAVRSCHVVYDIWTAHYAVDIRTESEDRSLTIDTLDGVIEACLVADHVPLGDAAAWRSRAGEHVTFGVRVELNPVTPDMVQRIRRWLARPEGGAHDEAFFGSFVSYFVTRQIGDAERTLLFHQELTCP
jgi:hypothetical protein